MPAYKHPTGADKQNTILLIWCLSPVRWLRLWEAVEVRAIFLGSCWQVQGKHRKSKGLWREGGGKGGNPGEDRRNAPSAVNLTHLSVFTKSHHIFWKVFYITCIFSSSYNITIKHIFDVYFLHSLKNSLWILGFKKKKCFFYKNACCSLKYVLSVLCMLFEIWSFSFLHKFFFTVICKGLLSCFRQCLETSTTHF